MEHKKGRHSILVLVLVLVLALLLLAFLLIPLLLVLLLLVLHVLVLVLVLVLVPILLLLLLLLLIVALIIAPQPIEHPPRPPVVGVFPSRLAVAGQNFMDPHCACVSRHGLTNRTHSLYEIQQSLTALS